VKTIIGVLLIVLTSLSACKNSTTGDGGDQDKWMRNPWLKQLTFYNDFSWTGTRGDALFVIPAGDGRTLWHQKADYSTIARRPENVGIWRLDTSSTFTWPKDTLFVNGYFDYAAISNSGTEMAVVESLVYSISGSLSIIDLTNRTRQRTNVGLRVVYGAIFAENDSVLILYGEQNEFPSSRGYYRYKRLSRTISLLFLESLGFYGFDISPDGRKLIYPRSPKYLTRDLISGTIDTGQVYAEWLRFSPDGSKILYTTSTLNRYVRSDIGIISVTTGTNTLLDVRLISPKLGDTFAANCVWALNGKSIYFVGVPQSTLGTPGPLGNLDVYSLSLNY